MDEKKSVTCESSRLITSALDGRRTRRTSVELLKLFLFNLSKHPGGVKEWTYSCGIFLKTSLVGNVVFVDFEKMIDELIRKFFNKKSCRKFRPDSNKSRLHLAVPNNSIRPKSIFRSHHLTQSELVVIYFISSMPSIQIPSIKPSSVVDFGILFRSRKS